MCGLIHTVWDLSSLLPVYAGNSPLHVWLYNISFYLFPWPETFKLFPGVDYYQKIPQKPKNKKTCCERLHSGLCLKTCLPFFLGKYLEME